ncbi:MAG TPA: 6-bladed beta-propeller [Bryobacteraceae bacterium]|nr:6-bladed beta-propeller [Bryobacteraceae bacterium]
MSKRATIIAGLVAVLAAMCTAPAEAGAKKKPATADATKLGDLRTKAYFDINKIVWPNPPAIARIKFVDLFTGEKVDPNQFSKQNRRPKQKWMDRLAGAQNVNEIDAGKLPFQLIRTYGLAFDSKGRIYAADQGVGAVFIFDPKTKTVEMIRNGKEAHFGLIMGLAIDDDDRMFVSDAKLHRVLVLSSQHEQLASVGMDVLVNPGGLAIDRENRLLYVVDTGNDTVVVFDADSFKKLRNIGKPSRKHTATDPGSFSLPTNVAVDSEGDVYVTDTFNNRVQIFDADGEFLGAFGKNGDGPGHFERPKGIAVDCDRHIWVVDAAQDRVKVFDREGRLLIYFGEHGEYPGRFMGAYGIAIDKENRVAVSETFPGRVQMFRYVNDAEAEAEMARRATGSQTNGGTR